jgi:hypothetical protein
MSKNPKIPDTWGIPDDQANKVRDVFSKKSIKPEDAVQKAIDDLARDIAIIEPDPEDWGWWVLYALEQLEIRAEKRRIINQYEHTLNVLVEKLQNRIKGGKC